MIRVADSSVTLLGSKDNVKTIITCMTEANDGRAKTMTMDAIMFHLGVQVIGNQAYMYVTSRSTV